MYRYVYIIIFLRLFFLGFHSFIDGDSFWNGATGRIRTPGCCVKDLAPVYVAPALPDELPLRPDMCILLEIKSVDP